MISIAVAVLILIAIVLVVRGFTIVPQGMVYTIERLGKYVKTISPGWHYLTPVSRVSRKVNMMEQVIDIPAQEILSRDKALIHVDGVLFFRIFDASKAAYEVTNLNRATLHLVMTSIRIVISAMSLEELLSKRDEIDSMIIDHLKQSSNAWGVEINRILIKEIAPPEQLMESMTNQMSAERQRRADILEAEGFRKAQILKAEGTKHASILKAEGDKEASFRSAEARERLAQAEAKATMMVSHAISKGDVNAINYFIAQGYTQALEKIGSAKNSKVVMLPLEATSLVNSIDGIHELTKTASEA